MTVSSAQQVVRDVEAYMVKFGAYREWYAGVAADPRARLFNDHNVQEKSDAWIYRQCESDDAARQVEQYFLAKGCQGGTGGGGQGTRSFYAYKIQPHTVE